jgi:hypothetical protein
VYIVVVGVVYTLLLSQLYHPHGWAKFADVLVHDVTPVSTPLQQPATE